MHLHANVAPKRGLLGDILVTIWQPWCHPWKVCFLTTLLHFSSIPPSHAGSQISLFGCCFWYPLWEAYRGRHFCGFGRFLAPWGEPWGTHFQTFGWVLGGSVFGSILKKKVKRIGVRMRQWMVPAWPSRSCKDLQTGLNTPGSPRKRGCGGYIYIYIYISTLACARKTATVPYCVMGGVRWGERVRFALFLYLALAKRVLIQLL